jgi:hypothetical protein
MGNAVGCSWQRNYCETIIRDAAGLACIRDYILANPARSGEREHHHFEP